MLKVGVDWKFGPSLDFYTKKDRLDWLRTNTLGPHESIDFHYLGNKKMHTLFDYYYLHDSNLARQYDLDIIHEFPVSDTYIARGKP